MCVAVGFGCVCATCMFCLDDVRGTRDLSTHTHSATQPHSCFSNEINRMATYHNGKNSSKWMLLLPSFVGSFIHSFILQSKCTSHRQGVSILFFLFIDFDIHGLSPSLSFSLFVAALFFFSLPIDLWRQILCVHKERVMCTLDWLTWQNNVWTIVRMPPKKKSSFSLVSAHYVRITCQFISNHFTHPFVCHGMYGTSSYI